MSQAQTAYVIPLNANTTNAIIIKAMIPTITPISK